LTSKRNKTLVQQLLRIEIIITGSGSLRRHRTDFQHYRWDRLKIAMETTSRSLTPLCSMAQRCSCVSRPSSCRFANGPLLWTCRSVGLRFCRPVIPSSCQIVLTRHPKTTSCQDKLVTTHVLAPCPKSIPAPKSLTSAQVMNQL